LGKQEVKFVEFQEIQRNKKKNVSIESVEIDTRNICKICVIWDIFEESILIACDQRLLNSSDSSF